MKQNSLVLSILLVVGFPEHLKYSRLIPAKYKSKIVHSVRSMESVVNVQSPDLIILDNDLVKCEEDKNSVRVSAIERIIPIVLLVKSPHEALENLSIGIADFFIKPVIPELLLTRIDIHMRLIQDLKISTKLNIKIHEKLQEKSDEIIRLQTSIIGVLSEAIEFRDFDTETHNLRTQGYIDILIRKMLEVPNTYRREVALWNIEDHVFSSQLHDIGKIGIPDSVLLKKDPLTPEEYQMIQKHVIIGVRIVDKILKRSGENAYLEIAKKYIMYHHEYWNGKGYPNHIAGTDIPLEGRLLGIVDVYDAITSKRPYKIAESHTEAVATINANSGIQFDPEIVRIFNMVSDQFKQMLNK